MNSILEPAPLIGGVLLKKVRSKLKKIKKAKRSKRRVGRPRKSPLKKRRVVLVRRGTKRSRKPMKSGGRLKKRRVVRKRKVGRPRVARRKVRGSAYSAGAYSAGRLRKRRSLKGRAYSGGSASELLSKMRALLDQLGRECKEEKKVVMLKGISPAEVRATEHRVEQAKKKAHDAVKKIKKEEKKAQVAEQKVEKALGEVEKEVKHAEQKVAKVKKPLGIRKSVALKKAKAGKGLKMRKRRRVLVRKSKPKKKRLVARKRKLVRRRLVGKGYPYPVFGGYSEFYPVSGGMAGVTFVERARKRLKEKLDRGEIVDFTEKDVQDLADQLQKERTDKSKEKGVKYGRPSKKKPEEIVLDEEGYEVEPEEEEEPKEEEGQFTIEQLGQLRNIQEMVDEFRKIANPPPEQLDILRAIRDDLEQKLNTLDQLGIPFGKAEQDKIRQEKSFIRENIRILNSTFSDSGKPSKKEEKKEKKQERKHQPSSYSAEQNIEDLGDIYGFVSPRFGSREEYFGENRGREQPIAEYVDIEDPLKNLAEYGEIASIEELEKYIAPVFNNIDLLSLNEDQINRLINQLARESQKQLAKLGRPDILEEPIRQGLLEQFREAYANQYAKSGLEQELGLPLRELEERKAYNYREKVKGVEQRRKARVERKAKARKLIRSNRRAINRTYGLQKKGIKDFYKGLPEAEARFASEQKELEAETKRRNDAFDRYALRYSEEEPYEEETPILRNPELNYIESADRYGTRKKKKVSYDIQEPRLKKSKKMPRQRTKKGKKTKKGKRPPSLWIQHVKAWVAERRRQGYSGKDLVFKDFLPEIRYGYYIDQGYSPQEAEAKAMS